MWTKLPIDRRRSQSNCEEGDRHCSDPVEQNQNIFEREAASLELPLCASNDDGSYGETDNDGDTVLIEFQYQIQTSLSLTAAVLQSDESPILTIEKGISDVLVERFFGDRLCALPTTQVRRVLRQRWLQEGLTGLLATPADHILPGRAGVACQSDLVEHADRCYAIGGALTLTGLSISDFTGAASMSKLFIQDAMDNGLLNDKHADIHDVSFTSKDPYVHEEFDKSYVDSNIVSTLTDEVIVQEESSNVWLWTLLVCLAILVLVAFWLTRKMASNQQHLIEEERSQLQMMTDGGHGHVDGAIATKRMMFPLFSPGNGSGSNLDPVFESHTPHHNPSNMCDDQVFTFDVAIDDPLLQQQQQQFTTDSNSYGSDTNLKHLLCDEYGSSSDDEDDFEGMMADYQQGGFPRDKEII